MSIDELIIIKGKELEEFIKDVGNPCVQCTIVSKGKCGICNKLFCESCFYSWDHSKKCMEQYFLTKQGLQSHDNVEVNS